MTSILQDIQYAARSLRKSPLFAAIAVTSVALGIGANAAVFTLLDQVVLRLLPVKDPAALVQVRAADGPSSYGGGMGDGIGAVLSDVPRLPRSQRRCSTACSAATPTRCTSGDGGRSERVNGEMVSGTFFQVLGVGRRDRPHCFSPPTIAPPSGIGGRRAQLRLLAHAVRRQARRARPQARHQRPSVHGDRRRAPAGFNGLDLGTPPQVYVPMTMQPQLGPAWLKIDDAAIPLGAGLRAAAQRRHRRAGAGGAPAALSCAHAGARVQGCGVRDGLSRDAEASSSRRASSSSRSRAASRGCATRSACP